MLSVTMAGLNAAQKSMDVASNNMANANTVGFERSYATFGDIFSNDPAADPKTAVGSGVSTSSVTRDTTAGALTTTGRVTDMAINGRGFFVVQDPAGGPTSFTRAGTFNLDKMGHLIDNSGNVLQGYPSVGTGTFDASGTEIMKPQAGTLTGITVSTQYSAGTVLPDGKTIAGQEIQSMTFSGPATASGTMQISGVVAGQSFGPVPFLVTNGMSSEDIVKAATAALTANNTKFPEPSNVKAILNGNSSSVQIAFNYADGAVSPLTIQPAPNPGPSYSTVAYSPLMPAVQTIANSEVASSLPMPPVAGTFVAQLSDGANSVNVPVSLTLDNTGNYNNLSVNSQIAAYLSNPANVPSGWSSRAFQVDGSGNLKITCGADEASPVATIGLTYNDTSSLFNNDAQVIPANALLAPPVNQANFNLNITDSAENSLAVPIVINKPSESIADQVVAYINAMQDPTSTIYTSTSKATRDLWARRSVSKDSASGDLKISAFKNTPSILDVAFNDTAAWTNATETLADSDLTKNLTAWNNTQANVHLTDGTNSVDVPVTFTRNGLSYDSIASQIKDYFNTNASSLPPSWSGVVAAYDSASSTMKLTATTQALPKISWSYAPISGPTLPTGVPATPGTLKSIGVEPNLSVTQPTPSDINIMATNVAATPAQGAKQTLIFSTPTTDATLKFNGVTLSVNAGDTLGTIAINLQNKLKTAFGSGSGINVQAHLSADGSTDGIQVIYPANSGNLTLQAPNWTTSEVTKGNAVELSKGSSSPVLMQGVSIGSNGEVSATYSNGATYSMGFIALANFANNSGLKDVGNNRFVQTGNSGSPLITPAGAPQAGNIMSGQLEQSNVDITNELMSMIRAQQVYNGNARVLQTMVDTVTKITDLR